MIAFMIFRSIQLPVMALMMSLGAQCIAQTGEPRPTPAYQVLSTSPDGNFVVRREQAEAGERGEARKQVEICSASGKVLYSWISALGSTSMLWSPDSNYLAINDMPGESGDLLTIFHLDLEKTMVVPVRQADGKALLHEEEVRHGSFLSSVDRVNLRAQEWKGGKLWCLLTGSSHPKRQPMVHVSFHRLRVLDMQGNALPILSEEWTLTDPKEQAIRDSNP